MRTQEIDFFCWKNKYALYNFVARNLKLKYRKSIIGALWTLIIPATTAVVFYFVFQYVMRVNIPNYLLFVLAGMIPWTFFQSSITTGLESIVNNHGILNKVPLAPHIFPLSETLTSFMNLLLSIPVIVVLTFFYSIQPDITWLQIPLLLIALFLQGYAFSLICGVVFVYLRDFRPITAVIIQIWFYLTPVIYSESMLPEKFAFIKYLNPVFYIFSGFHNIITMNKGLSISEFSITLMWTAFAISISYLLYAYNRKHLIERL